MGYSYSYNHSFNKDAPTWNIQIKDGYLYSKRHFDRVLDEYKKKDPTSLVWQRSRFALKMEWISHNFLYKIGWKRERTKDVDLNYPNKWSFVYIVFGIFVYLFVK